MIANIHQQVNRIVEIKSRARGLICRQLLPEGDMSLLVMADARGNHYVKLFLHGEDTQATQEGDSYLLGEATECHAASELVGLTASDVNLDEGLLKVCGKGNDEHTCCASTNPLNNTQRMTSLP
jgi:hypothetical protein